MLTYVLLFVGIPALCVLAAVLGQSTISAWFALPVLIILGLGLATAIVISRLSRAERRRFFTREGQREAWSSREPGDR